MTSTTAGLNLKVVLENIEEQPMMFMLFPYKYNCSTIIIEYGQLVAVIPTDGFDPYGQLGFKSLIIILVHKAADICKHKQRQNLS